jgi:hypothetical protein
MTQTIRLKRQTQVGPSAVGKKPTTSLLEDGELAVNTVDGKLFLKRTDEAGNQSIVEVGADPFPNRTNQNGKFLMTDGTSVSWATPGVVSRAAIDVVQMDHGFDVGTVLYHDGSSYAPARADSTATADVIGFVTAVADANHFTLTTNGFFSFEGTTLETAWQTIPAGETEAFWVPGRTYYLSPTTAGGITKDEPTQAGYINKPLIVAINSTAEDAGPRGFFYNWRGISNEIPYSDIDNLLPAQDSSTAGKVLVSGADGNAYWGGASGGSGNSGANSSISVMQTSHGFSTGTILRYDGSVGANKYVPAQSNNSTNADVIGIVSEVTDADNFTITTQGIITNLAGLVPGASYFLSDTTPGGFQLTEPTAQTAISKPVLIAVSTTDALFVNWRGIALSILSVAPEVAPQSGHNGKYLSTNGASTFWNTPVTSFNTRTGAVTLNSSDVVSALGYTPYNGSTNPNNYASTSNVVSSFNGRVGTVSLTLTDLANVGGAPLASPAFTGNPTAPTPAAGDNDTSIATTAFVQSAILSTGLGYGQTWQAVSRSPDITYTNSTGKPIVVAVYAYSAGLNGGMTGYVNGTAVYTSVGIWGYSSVDLVFIVPDGATYRVSNPGVAVGWMELR